MICGMEDQKTIPVCNTPVSCETVITTALSMMGTHSLPGSFVASVLKKCGGAYLFLGRGKDAESIRRFAVRYAMTVPHGLESRGHILIDEGIDGFILSRLADGFRVITENGIVEVPARETRCVIQPDYDDAVTAEKAEQLPVDAMLLYDRTAGKTLLAKNEDKPIFAASIVKLLTALVVVENIPDLSHTETYFDMEMVEHLKAKNTSLTFLTDLPVQKWSAEILLYGMLLPSGCECAEQLARLVCDGDTARFVRMMNEKAARLGCTHTHCTDASGLDEGAYTTARDILVIFEHFLQVPYLRHVLSAAYATFDGFPYPFATSGWIGNPVGGGMRYFPYLVCGKTGTGSGLHHVGLFRRGRKEYISVILQYTHERTGYSASYFLRLQHILLGYAFEAEHDYVRIRLSHNYKKLSPGESYQLRATVLRNQPGTVPKLKIFSSDPTVAEVLEDGRIRVLKKGTATVTVRSETGDSDRCYLNATGTTLPSLRSED